MYAKMPDLLVIGGITPTMQDRLEAAFTLHRLADMDDPVEWLSEQGEKITHVLMKFPALPHVVQKGRPHGQLTAR